MNPKADRKIPEITIVLDRLRSAHNVGNIFRLADAVGAKEIICCGYTAAPPHPKLEKTAMGADKNIPYRIFPDSLEAVRNLRTEGYAMILAVESLPEALDAWEVEYKFPLALIFGNEALGVHPDTLKEVDGTVCLPMFGMKTSVNVGNCVAAVLYSVVARHFKR